MARLTALLPLLILAEVQQAWSSLKTPSTRRLSSKAFFESPDLHDAVTDTFMALGGSSHLGDRAAVYAHVAEGFQNVTQGAPESTPELTWQQKVELVSLVRSLGNLSLHSSLRRLSETDASQPVVFTYQSSDGEGNNGTGTLGSTGAGSVSKVALQQVPEGISFTVGPAVGGMYLIRGKMDVTQRGQGHMSGNIRAGFVNLRSTLSGTWQAEGTDFNSTLHIHLTEMGFNEEWTWSPEP